MLLLTLRQGLKECTAFSVDRIPANQPAQEMLITTEARLVSYRPTLTDQYYGAVTRVLPTQQCPSSSRSQRRPDSL